MRLLEKGVLVTVGFAALGLGAGLLGIAAAFVLAAIVSLVFAIGRIHRRVAPLDRWWRPAGARRLARELAPVAQAQFLGVATSRLAPVALVLLTSDQATGYFGAAFRVYDVAWVVLTSLEAAVFPVAGPDVARAPALPGAHDPGVRGPAARRVADRPRARRGGVLADAVDLRSRVRPHRPGPGRPGRRRRLRDAGASSRRRVAGPRSAPSLARGRGGGVRDGLVAIPGLVALGGALGAAVGILVVEGVTLAASRLASGARRLAARSRGGQGPGRRGGRPGHHGLLPAGVGRPAGALLAYAVALVVLRPIPRAVCLRLLRGALGRSGPTSAAGVG